MGKALGGIPGPSGNTDDRMAPVEDTEREVEIHLGGDGTGGGGGLGGGGTHQASPENGRTVHCYAVTVRTV